MCSLDTRFSLFLFVQVELPRILCAFPKYVTISRKPHESSRNLTCCRKWLRIMVVSEWLMTHDVICVRKLLY